MRREFRWFFTDGLPILLGVAIIPVGVVLFFAFHAPQRALHWWSCNSGATGTPTWSPNGRLLAFAGSGRCDTRVFVVRRDGSRRQMVASSFADWPAWSHDGRTILVNTRNGYGIVPAVGGKVEQVRGSESDIGAAWSPDGTEIAFTHGFLPGPGGDYESTLYVMRHDGTGVRRLIGHSCDPGAPAWSPDGRSIAVACYDGLYVLSLLNGERHRVWKEDFGFDPPTPSWSPDAKTLGYIDADSGIYVLPSNGSQRPRLLVAVKLSSWADSMAWSPDGRWIAFSGSVGRHPGGIYVATSEGRDVHLIARF